MATVNYTPDPNNKPQLTKEQEAKLAARTDGNYRLLRYSRVG